MDACACVCVLCVGGADCGDDVLTDSDAKLIDLKFCRRVLCTRSLAEANLSLLPEPGAVGCESGLICDVVGVFGEPGD